MMSIASRTAKRGCRSTPAIWQVVCYMPTFDIVKSPIVVTRHVIHTPRRRAAAARFVCALRLYGITRLYARRYVAAAVCLGKRRAAPAGWSAAAVIDAAPCRDGDTNSSRAVWCRRRRCAPARAAQPSTAHSKCRHGARARHGPRCARAPAARVRYAQAFTSTIHTRHGTCALIMASKHRR